MRFESNRLKTSWGGRAGCDSRGTVGTAWWPDHKTLYACTFLSRGSQQSGSGIENLSTMRRARCAEQARGAMGADGNDTGGKDERLREHRIGHFRLQACGGRGDDVPVAFASPLYPRE